MKFPKKNMLTEWLKKYGDPEIEKQVEREAELLNSFYCQEQIEDKTGGGV